jgi:hypothetical protein
VRAHARRWTRALALHHHEARALAQRRAHLRAERRALVWSEHAERSEARHDLDDELLRAAGDHDVRVA